MTDAISIKHLVTSLQRNMLKLGPNLIKVKIILSRRI